MPAFKSKRLRAFSDFILHIVYQQVNFIFRSTCEYYSANQGIYLWNRLTAACNNIG